ncbi:MAG: SdpI family protein [bacterium]
MSDRASPLLREWYPIILALLGAGISFAVFSRLPARMATHWDLQGNANGWMPRSVGAILLPVILLVMWALMSTMSRIDPRRANDEKFAGAYEMSVAAILCMLFAGHLIVLGIALGYHVPVAHILPALIGTAFVVIGYVMPRTRSNFVFGIRTPWTLSSERVWTRTHRLAGRLMALAGFVMIVAGFLLPTGVVITVVIVAILASLMVPAAYSYFAWKHETR